MLGCCVLTGLKCTIIVIPPPFNRFLKTSDKIIIQNAILNAFKIRNNWKFINRSQYHDT